MKHYAKGFGLLELNGVSFLLQALDASGAPAPSPERKPRSPAAWLKGVPLAFSAGCIAVLAISVLAL